MYVIQLPSGPRFVPYRPPLVFYTRRKRGTNTKASTSKKKVGKEVTQETSFKTSVEVNHHE